MRIKVNQEACIGCGACASIAEGVFEFNEDGLSKPINETVDDNNTEVTVAVESCPTGAIHVEDVPENSEN